MKTKKTSITKNIRKQALPEAPENFKPRRKDEEAPEPKRTGDVVARFQRRHENYDEDELPLDAEPMGSRPLPPPFALVLEGVLQKLKLRVSPVAELLRADWDKLLPPEFKGRCLPGKIQRGYFYAYVPDSTVLFELQRELPRIEAALLPALANARVKHVRLSVEPETFLKCKM